MPELPEVETVAADLRGFLPGRTIRGAEVHRALPIAWLAPAEFCRSVAGERFASVERRGKYLILGFHSGRRLVAHLRMTGSWQYRPAGDPLDKHTHVVFELDNGYQLRFRDPRAFGRLYLMESDDYAAIKGLHGLGPEPMDSEFDAAWLGRALAGRKIAVKQALLDQRVAAGVGNIYADEALFLARIRPTRPAGSLQRPQLEALAGGVRQAIAEGIANRGTTLSDFVDTAGLIGHHQEHLRVYDRAGKPCVECGQPIERLRLAGRSAHFCPACQK